MSSKKCCETVFDITTKRSRKCKLYKHFREYCYIHAQVIYKKCAIVIQKIWRGFYARKKLENLFYNLPRELQSHVMKYVRNDHYIEKHWIPSVLKIYKNRLFQCHTLKKDLNFLYASHNIDGGEYQQHLYYLLRKEKNIHRMIDAFTDN